MKRVTQYASKMKWFSSIQCLHLQFYKEFLHRSVSYIHCLSSLQDQMELKLPHYYHLHQVCMILDLNNWSPTCYQCPGEHILEVRHLESKHPFAKERRWIDSKFQSAISIQRDICFQLCTWYKGNHRLPSLFCSWRRKSLLSFRKSSLVLLRRRCLALCLPDKKLFSRNLEQSPIRHVMILFRP